MRANSLICRFAIGSAFGLLVPVSALHAQGEAGHTMEIFNGSMRTVHYFQDRAAPREQAALADLTRAENEAALSEELTLLRRQYVSDERFLQARRTNVQQLLYGYSTQYSVGLYPEWSQGLYPYNTGWGYGSYPYGAWAGYPYLYGGYYGTSTLSLANGVGDEGRIKTEMARTLALQATPAHGLEVSQNLQRAASSTDLPKGVRRSR